MRLTPQQDVLLCDIATADAPAVESMLNEYGIPRPETLSHGAEVEHGLPGDPDVRAGDHRAERALPGIIDQLETVLAELGLADEPISVRMTGCPNGCARPYQSEVGIVGRSGDKYTLYVGGDSFGRRLNTELQDSVPIEQIVPKLAKVFAAFKAERHGRRAVRRLLHAGRDGEAEGARAELADRDARLASTSPASFATHLECTPRRRGALRAARRTR